MGGIAPVILASPRYLGQTLQGRSDRVTEEESEAVQEILTPRSAAALAPLTPRSAAALAPPRRIASANSFSLARGSPLVVASPLPSGSTARSNTVSSSAWAELPSPQQTPPPPFDECVVAVLVNPGCPPPHGLSGVARESSERRLAETNKRDLDSRWLPSHAMLARFNFVFVDVVGVSAVNRRGGECSESNFLSVAWVQHVAIGLQSRCFIFDFDKL